MNKGARQWYHPGIRPSLMTTRLHSQSNVTFKQLERLLIKLDVNLLMTFKVGASLLDVLGKFKRNQPKHQEKKIWFIVACESKNHKTQSNRKSVGTEREEVSEL